MLLNSLEIILISEDTPGHIVTKRKFAGVVSTTDGSSPESGKTDSALFTQWLYYLEVLSMVYRRVIRFYFSNPHQSTRRLLVAQGHIVSGRSIIGTESTDMRANVVIDF